MGIDIRLTEEEATLLSDYLFRKLVRLKESGLEDAKCFIAFDSIRRKLKEGKRHG